MKFKMFKGKFLLWHQILKISVVSIDVVICEVFFFHLLNNNLLISLWKYPFVSLHLVLYEKSHERQSVDMLSIFVLLVCVKIETYLHTVTNSK